eukprot:5416301-Prymnesium_polylepis.1
MFSAQASVRISEADLTFMTFGVVPPKKARAAGRREGDVEGVGRLAPVFDGHVAVVIRDRREARHVAVRAEVVDDARRAGRRMARDDKAGLHLADESARLHPAPAFAWNAVWSSPALLRTACTRS